MSTSDVTSKARNNSVELLRCILMFLIVLHHMCLFYAQGGGIAVRACSALTAFSTDAFAFITGFYGTRFKWSKASLLLGVGMFASVVLWGAGNCLLDGGAAYRFSLGWFGNSYLALLLVVPFVNRLLKNCRGMQGLFAWPMAVIVLRC